MIRIGSLFSGYGGLDMAVQAIYGGELAWYAEIEPAACKVLAAHHLGAPNLGDVKAVDWSAVEPVDVLTGGYPCQPFSSAGSRKGTEDERHLWPYVADAIRVLRPTITILENVRGHLTLGFDTVLADLAELGLSARWGTVRASDAGAPHGRARVFIIVTDPDRCRWNEYEQQPLDKRTAQGERQSGHPYGHCSDGSTADAVSGIHGSKSDESFADRSGRSDPLIDWGKYGAAIARWERLTRPAPAPTVPGVNGRPRLSPFFVEWMMGLPEGHVTGHGLSAAQALKMLGNGVVPQQAILALKMIGGS